MDVKHIYWFAFYNPVSPSVRYRGKYVLDHLYSESGISNNFFYPDKGFNNKLRFLKIYLKILLFRKKNSVLVFQKIYTDHFYARALKLLLFFRKSNTLYDIDDAEYLRNSDKNIKYFIKKCEVCSVGSVFLIDYVKPLNPNVIFLTSPIVEHFEHKKVMAKQFTIGWIGEYTCNNPNLESYSHKTNLMQLVFPAIMELEFNLTFKIFGISSSEEKSAIRKYFSQKNNITLVLDEPIDWFSESDINNKISTFDVGLSPLMDNDFNKSKSAYKLKQCFSCGIPVLASPVGEHLNILIHGENGFFCKDAKEFADRIIYFNNISKEEYFKFSIKALNATSGFSMNNHNYEFLEHYKSQTL